MCCSCWISSPNPKQQQQQFTINNKYFTYIWWASTCERYGKPHSSKSIGCIKKSFQCVLTRRWGTQRLLSPQIIASNKGNSRDLFNTAMILHILLCHLSFQTPTAITFLILDKVKSILPSSCRPVTSRSSPAIFWTHQFLKTTSLKCSLKSPPQSFTFILVSECCDSISPSVASTINLSPAIKFFFFSCLFFCIRQPVLIHKRSFVTWCPTGLCP